MEVEGRNGSLLCPGAGQADPRLPHRAGTDGPGTASHAQSFHGERWSELIGSGTLQCHLSITLLFGAVVPKMSRR